jgi:A/G-specific adenine glycosylase
LYIENDRRRAVRRSLRRWYDRDGRDLPWRHTRDPYAVLVSEVMLQQTQVSRVVPAYRAFLRRFPTLRALARAPLADALRAWSGLGYNRRARDLHRIARAMPHRLPADRAGLDALPGVGAYTAGAVACFAHGERVAFADTNIRRVLGRIALGRVATEREATTIDVELMPRSPAPWHHALMDLGATICLSRTPRCEACPVAEVCRGRGRAAPAVPRRQASFATSTRRLRGLAMRLLTESPSGVTRTRLARELADPRAAQVIAALARDGLVETDARVVRLAR